MVGNGRVWFGEEMIPSGEGGLIKIIGGMEKIPGSSCCFENGPFPPRPLSQKSEKSEICRLKTFYFPKKRM